MQHFLDRVLELPSYGYLKEGALVVPTNRQILAEWVMRMNVFACKKKWLSLFSWFTSLVCAVPLYLFFTSHFSLGLLAIAFVYSMIIMGSHGTLWLHRYGTHRAYTFKNRFARTLFRNLVIRTIPEETYVLSHHVHHRLSEQPGDPYNVNGGWLYCFLSDANHQAANPSLSRDDYATACKLLSHTGVKINSYEQYQRWGTLSHPLWAVAHYVANWGFWFAVFFTLGGTPLVVAIFGSAGVWAVGVRTFNYDGHGGGKDKRKDGIDFNREDLSINQVWAGYVAGEWHNNHHLYPNGARSGFLPYQLDLPFQVLRFGKWIGAISAYKDYKADFLGKHYAPYLLQKEQKEQKERNRTETLADELAS